MAKIDGSIQPTGKSSKEIGKLESALKSGVNRTLARTRASEGGPKGVSKATFTGGSTQSPEGISGKSKKGSY